MLHTTKRSLSRSLGAAAIAALAAFGAAKAQVNLATWTYEPLIGTAAAPQANSGVFAASASSNLVGAMVGFGSTATGMNTMTGCGTQTSGTTAWAITTANPGSSDESSGAQWLVSTSGFINIKVQWEQRWSNTATNTVRFQYTTDGGGLWNNFTMTPSNTTFCLGSLNAGRFETNTTGDNYRRIEVDLTGIPGVDNNALFGFRVVAAYYQTTGQFRQVTNPANVATAGTWRFDNVQVSGLGAPTVQDSDVSFSSITTSSFDVSWTNGNGTKRVAILNTSNSFTDPADGTDPPANPVYSGSGEQVIYNGTGSTVSVSGLSPSTTYWVRVYGYNGSGTETLYLTSTATGNPNSATTSGSTPPTKLAITSLNGGDNIVENLPFYITVQSQDASNVPQNVSANTGVAIQLVTGLGTLS
ncbi:MAG: hypothetical protein ACK4L7_06810, partial [Flavobacteriales bacterium]